MNETFLAYLIWALFILPIGLIVAYLIHSRGSAQTNSEHPEGDRPQAPDPNPLLASPSMFDPHGIRAAAEQYGDQFDIRAHSQSESLQRWQGMHASRLEQVRENSDQPADHVTALPPTIRGGRSSGFVDRPSRRLTAEERKLHDEDAEHWKGMGGLRPDLSEKHGDLDDLDD